MYAAYADMFMTLQSATLTTAWNRAQHGLMFLKTGYALSAA